MVLDRLKSLITMVLDRLKLLTAATAAASGDAKRMVRNHWVETFLQFIRSHIFYKTTRVFETGGVHGHQ